MVEIFLIERHEGVIERIIECLAKPVDFLAGVVKLFPLIRNAVQLLRVDKIYLQDVRICKGLGHERVLT